MVGSFKVKYLFLESTNVNGNVYHKAGVMQSVGNLSDMRKLSIDNNCLLEFQKLKECDDIVIDIVDRMYNGQLLQKIVGVAKCQK